jgi:hypothetical protein
MIKTSSITLNPMGCFGYLSISIVSDLDIRYSNFLTLIVGDKPTAYLYGFSRAICRKAGKDFIKRS